MVQEAGPQSGQDLWENGWLAEEETQWAAMQLVQQAATGE